MNELQQAYNAIANLLPSWVIPVLALIGAIRVLLMKWINTNLQNVMNRALAWVVASEETDDDILTIRFLSHPVYRLIAFLLDLFLSLKLPTKATFLDLQAKAGVKSNGSGVALLAFLLAILLAGCLFPKQQLDPNADPLVVKIESVEVMGKETFDAVLTLDHTARGWWRTNAPGMHSFCEWLRQPIFIPTLNASWPRDRAMIYSLNKIKTDYKSSVVTSNDVYRALTTFESTLNEANAWMTIVTNKIK